MTSTYTPAQTLPFLYINGILVKNNAAAPNTSIDVGPGICRDSTNTFDLNIGNAGGVISNVTADTTTTINTNNVGANGLDTGVLLASKMYYIYVIQDMFGTNGSAAIASLNGPATGPVMPFGYNAHRWVGCYATDASVHFLVGYYQGNNNTRELFYDAPQATAITAGNATAYTAVDLVTLVPNLEGVPVWIASAFTPGAASRVLNLQPAGATGDAITITGQVTSVVVSTNSYIRSSLSSSLPKISYKVTNSGDAVALNVAGFVLYL